MFLKNLDPPLTQILYPPLVNLVDLVSPIECLLRLTNVRAIQYKLGRKGWPGSEIQMYSGCLWQLSLETYLRKEGHIFLRLQRFDDFYLTVCNPILVYLAPDDQKTTHQAKQIVFFHGTVRSDLSSSCSVSFKHSSFLALKVEFHSSKVCVFIIFLQYFFSEQTY